MAQEQRQLELSYSSGSPSEHCSRSRRCCCPPGSWVLKDVFSEGSRVEALTAAPVPANKPANAAPASVAFVVFVISTSPVRFTMRYGTPCDTLCASWIANLAARSDQLSFWSISRCPRAPRQSCSVPLNENLESPEGFQNSRCKLGLKAGKADCRTRNTIGSSPNLEVGRVVSRFCVDAERWKTLGSSQFDFDLAPTGVAGAITWVVAQDILVS